MSFCASFKKEVFNFNFNARTSRGLMKDKTSWFIKIWREGNPNVYGIGECGPLQGLSVDDRPDFEHVLNEVVEKVKVAKTEDFDSSYDIPDVTALVPVGFPSITFGLEMALLDLRNGGERIIFKNTFLEQEAIPINGLIWMGSTGFMMDQINKKVQEGFSCIKLKVGGLDFDRECEVIEYIRKRYFKEDLIIRLDANGAFKEGEALAKLNQLSKYNIDSIEQPIKPGATSMERLCQQSPIPIAFDEELIGKETTESRYELLAKLKPQFIILKPSLHGGLRACAEWIALAERLGIGWWITSALESSVGLNAICQFTANYSVQIHQGLGTGSIYKNNIKSPLRVANGKIFYDPAIRWDLESV